MQNQFQVNTIKATLYIFDYVDKENRMDWDNIQNFEEEGNEIDSQSMSLQRLGNLLNNEMKHQIIESKKVQKLKS